MFREWFSRAAAAPDLTAWWAAANAAVAAPTEPAESALRASAVDATKWPDVAETQEEFLDGLRALRQVLGDDRLPVVDTQHRVIGTDVCHYVTTASLAAQVDAGGRLFVTSSRLLLATGAVQAWPWHQVTAVERVERDLLLQLRGRPPAHLRLNNYEAALVVTAMANRLTRRAG